MLVTYILFLYKEFYYLKTGMLEFPVRHLRGFSFKSMILHLSLDLHDNGLKERSGKIIVYYLS